jgi:hypothetical protein
MASCPVPRIPVPDPTHGDILERIADLRGQVTTLSSLTAQRQDDINRMSGYIRALEQNSATHSQIEGIETRMRSMETQVARWAGVLLATTLAAPVAVPLLKQTLLHPQAQVSDACSTPVALAHFLPVPLVRLHLVRPSL